MKRVSKQGLEQKLKEVVSNYMKSLGFSNGEINNYTRVNLNPVVEGSEYCKITVSAELSYDELEELAEELDRIIAVYDNTAYFEAETSGRLVAYMDASAIAEPTLFKKNPSIAKSSRDKALLALEFHLNEAHPTQYKIEDRWDTDDGTTLFLINEAGSKYALAYKDGKLMNTDGDDVIALDYDENYE